MKKFLILILTTLVFAVADAQIFTQKEIRDKFDDVVSKREIKTLITKNDTAIIIEEKGKEPVTFKILNVIGFDGSKDNIVQLVGNVYGYEECWCVILEKYVKDYFLDISTLSNEEDDSKRHDLISKLVEKYCNFITHRVVTTKYGTELLGEYYWIVKASFNGDNERTIYSKDY